MKAFSELLRIFAFAILVFGSALPAQADTALGLYKSFSGNVNFSGTQVSMRDRPGNGNACRVSSESTILSASLSLPALANVVSAQLYWAGSGSVDTAVTMNGKAVGAGRSYTSSTIGGGLDYFSSAADVTEQVRLKGSGTYTFSGLKVSNGSPWCERSAVMGGYALVVVYSHVNEPFRTLNLYEGFRSLLNGAVQVDMANFRVPDNVSSSAMGRFGHLVWEGDQTIAREGESVSFNNVTLVDPPFAPSGNNFNSKSSINSDEKSIGIDFDAFSVGPWTAKQNAVSAVFRTGGDMVLLNAAMLAVPSTGAADLAIELVRNNELRVGSTVSYTATVTNLGPASEPGPVTVKLTLPAGLSYSSGVGSNWSCTGSGVTATCTYSGVLEKDAKAVLTLKAVVSTTGTKTTSVSVSGNNDPAAANNQASDTASVSAAGGISFAYTKRACLAGELVGEGGACPVFEGPVIAGTTATIYLTAVDSAGKAYVQSSSDTTYVTLYMALGCVNPSSSADGIMAVYGGLKLPACSRDASVPATNVSNETVWKGATAAFAPKQVSLAVSFRYVEVGAVKLYVRNSNATDFVQFVSIPDKLKVVVTNAQGQAPNPGDYSLAQNGFVRAGERFSVKVTALPAITAATTGTDPAELSNFGLETGDAQRPALRHTLSRLDTAAAGATGVVTAPLAGAYPAAGAFNGSFYWSDIGSFSLRVSLDNYLGEDAAAFGEVKVGRVYPAYFSTRAGPGFACLPRMRCPDVGLAKVNGAVYSRQPFDVTISAHDENGRVLDNFTPARFPALVPKITLTAVDAPGTGVALAKILPGLLDAAGAATTRSVSFGLGTPFDAGAARTAWLGPTAVYLRATARDSRFSTALTISSVQGQVAESEEGGIMVLNGRLAITNVIGSELLKTPIPMQAQYWTGTNWENNASFSHSTLLTTAQAVFSDCKRSLSLRGATGSACNTQLVKSASSGPLVLSSGTARLVLAPVGAGNFGSFRIQMKTEEWLPSMFGQVTIGAYKSPVIYIREMY
jgi:uncharacterized repeat protein (TIGR01451 family)